MAQAYELSTSLLRVTMNAVHVKYVKSPHTGANRYNRIWEAVISPAYASKDQTRDRNNKRISYSGFLYDCQCTFKRVLRQATLFCDIRAPHCFIFRILKYSPVTYYAIALQKTRELSRLIDKISKFKTFAKMMYKSL